MSSDSETTTSSKLRQFGLYRTIDARTEEFLKLSRRRQIRQGCACAAVSTAITVTVVVVILLIYEYAIAVESNLVQTILDSYGNGTSWNGTEDNPVADRLDRSYFGFDQDYYERMPLLVNAMQENHYIDPILEMSFPAKRARVLKNKTTTTTTDYRTTSIRRTSPRPFIFEYRSPTPTPFGKTFGSKNWVESYRNAQRLQNLQQVIQYLEKTINAKFGDLYALPSSTHIAFSGVYVHPTPTKPEDLKATSPTLDLLLQSSNKIETRINHLSDPLFSFKPDNPSDVNLLADNIFRFAPTSTTVIDKQTTVPMFRSISNRKKHDNKDKNVVDLLQGASEIKNIEPPTVDKPNSFSVMLNYVPTKTTINTDYKQDDGTSSINKVYFTTSRPVKFHFKRKSSGPIRRMYPPRSIRRPISRSFNSPVKVSKPEPTKETTMIVHVNLYPQKTEVIDVRNMTEPKQDYTSTTTTTSVPYNTPQMTQTPEISIAGIEDHHDGSSGVIPVEARTYPPSPPPVATTPYFETTVSSTEVYTWSTNPLDIIKFSPEDAKIPDQYMDLRKTDVTESPTQMTRRNFRHSIEMHEDVEPSTLIVKLKNEIKTTTQESMPIADSKEESVEPTTEQTYVPQINGHYRSVNQNSKIINDWFDKDEERKKNLEKIVTGVRRPTYVEIRRNNTKTIHKDDDDDDNDDDEDKT